MATKYAGFPEREAQRRSVAQLEELVNPTQPHAVRVSGVNYSKAKQALAQEKQRLEVISPPPLESDNQRKAIVERLKLAETAMLEGSAQLGIPPMPTKQQMWEGTDPNVDQHLAWENNWKRTNIDANGRPYKVDASKGQQGLLMEWKDLRRVLFQDREEEEGSVASIERLRREAMMPLANSVKRSYAMPKMTWAEYDQLMGGRSAMSDVQFKVREAEETGNVHVPSTEDIYKTSSGKPVCGATTANGDICQGVPTKNSERCRHHQGV